MREASFIHCKLYSESGNNAPENNYHDLPLSRDNKSLQKNKS